MSTPSPVTFALVTFVPVCAVMPCLRNDFASSADTASSSTGTRRGSSSRIVTSLPKRRKIERELDADRAAAHDRHRLGGTAFRWIASSLVMMRLRSMVMPGTLRGAEPVATMISRLARSVCLSPSNTSTPPLPVRRAVPLIQSILFFLNRNSTPLVRPVTTRSLRAWTCVMSMPTGAAEPSPIVTPHSFAFWTTFSACACSSSALVGMQPHSRQVPPSAFCFSTTATYNPSWAARIAAT